MATASEESASAGSSQLENLPNELLLQIFDNLEDERSCDGGRPALRNLAVTSRRLYPLANSRLYHYITNRTYFVTKGGFENVVEDSKLAAQIREIHWVDSVDHGNTYISRKEERVLAFLLLVAHNVRRLRVWALPFWARYKASRNGASDNHDPDDDGTPLWIHYLSGAATGDPIISSPKNWFLHLRELSITLESLHLDELTGVLQLAALRSLKLDHFYAHDSINEGRWRCASRTSPIQDVMLDQFSMSNDTLVEFLSLFQALRSFKMSSGEMQYPEEEGPPKWCTRRQKIEYPKIVAALHEHKDSLQHIRLEEGYPWEEHDSGTSPRDDTHEYDAEWLSLLRGLENVTSLVIGLRAFTDTPTTQSLAGDLTTSSRFARLPPNLPPRIQELYLFLERGTPEHMDQALDELADTCKQNLPELKQLDIRHYITSGGVVGGQDKERYESLFANAGIVCRMGQAMSYDQMVSETFESESQTPSPRSPPPKFVLLPEANMYAGYDFEFDIDENGDEREDQHGDDGDDGDEQ